MIQKTLISTIIGDALGSAVDGMSRGHVHSHFKRVIDYIDPEPALKNRPELWHKPGLYSSISQLMLIMAMACPRRGPCAESFCSAVAASPDVPGCDHGIFRYPGAVERAFLERVREQGLAGQLIEQPCGRIIPAVTFLSFRDTSAPDLVLDVMAAVRLFTFDQSTVASALIYTSLIRSLASGMSSDGPVYASVEAAATLTNTIEANSGKVFAGGVNPGSLVREVRAYHDLLSDIAPADSLASAEQTIISHVNRGLKTPITRATVNLPSALFPYALAVVAQSPAGVSPLTVAVSEGGSAAALTAMAGAISAVCAAASPLEETLIRNLVNRKKVLALVDLLESGTSAPGMMDDFIRSEASLTAKEREELAARLKHVKKKQKKPALTRAEKEKELARHAVESWTKLDKARWKKERRRHDKSDEP